MAYLSRSAEKRTGGARQHEVAPARPRRVVVGAPGAAGRGAGAVQRGQARHLPQHRAGRRQVAFQHRNAALFLERLVDREDHFRVPVLRTLHVVPDRLAVHGERATMQLAGAADLVLPSKLTNMLASGRPVVATADAGTGLAGEVEGCGLIVAPGDEAAFAAAIERLIDDSPSRNRLGAAARRRAEERWEREAIISGLERCMLDLVVAKSPVAAQPAERPA